MRESFDIIEFKPPTLAVIEQARTIIGQREILGFTLTLRQLFYQFVARGLIANDQTEYKRLGEYMSDARRAGYIDWDAIQDRTRFLRELPSWASPARSRPPLQSHTAKTLGQVSHTARKSGSKRML